MSYKWGHPVATLPESDEWDYTSHSQNDGKFANQRCMRSAHVIPPRRRPITAETAPKDYKKFVKQQRVAANVKYKKWLSKIQTELDDASDKVTVLEVTIPRCSACSLNQANAAARAADKGNAAAVNELEAELQRAKEGRIWARVREEAKRVQAEEESRTLRERFDSAQQQLSACSTNLPAGKQELIHLQSRFNELIVKVGDYQ
eukprot:6189000-Pleurochrysis_carterae.AAC.1